MRSTTNSSAGLNRKPTCSGTVFCFSKCRLCDRFAASRSSPLKPYSWAVTSCIKQWEQTQPLVSFTDTGILLVSFPIHLYYIIPFPRLSSKTRTYVCIILHIIWYSSIKTGFTWKKYPFMLWYSKVSMLFKKPCVNGDTVNGVVC